MRQVPFAFCPENADILAMSSRELVIDLVNKLPEDASLADIAREIELLAGIQTARPVGTTQLPCSLMTVITPVIA